MQFLAVDEGADFFHGVGGFGEKWSKQWKSMDHAWINFQSYGYPLTAGFFGEIDRIVEVDFMASNAEVERRKAVQVAVERRQMGKLGVVCSYVVLGPDGPGVLGSDVTGSIVGEGRGFAGEVGDG